VLRRGVKNLLCRIETKAVEMKFIDPITRVADEKFAHRPRVLAVKIERLAPFAFVAVGEIILGKNSQIISVRTEVIVNDIENQTEARGVCLVRKAAEIIRVAVEARRREDIDAIVTPPKFPGELRDRHDFEHRDAEIDKLGNLPRGRLPGAFARE